MFNRKALGVFLLLFISFLQAAAQEKKIPLTEPDYNKPKLFTSLPDMIPVTTEDMKQLLTGEEGQPASLRLDSKAIPAFRGAVTSRATKYEGAIQSVVLRSADFNGATLTLSAVKQPDGSVAYTGRIISMQHGDLFELKRTEEGYFFIKRNFYDLINE